MHSNAYELQLQLQKTWRMSRKERDLVRYEMYKRNWWLGSNVKHDSFKYFSHTLKKKNYPPPWVSDAGLESVTIKSLAFIPLLPQNNTPRTIHFNKCLTFLQDMLTLAQIWHCQHITFTTGTLFNKQFIINAFSTPIIFSYNPQIERLKFIFRVEFP